MLRTDRRTDRRTDGRMDRPKPICPLNFSEVGDIKIPRPLGTVEVSVSYHKSMPGDEGEISQEKYDVLMLMNCVLSRFFTKKITLHHTHFEKK